MGLQEKLKELEDELARTQKNKATEYHIGILKSKIAQIRRELISPRKHGASAGGFDVKKSGDATVAEGAAASYTLSLAGVLQAGGTTSVKLTLADVSTTSADYAAFLDAVDTAITGRSELAFNRTSGVLTFTSASNTR